MKKVEIQRMVVGLAGMAGEGKSTLLQSLMKGEERLALVDTLGEHAEWCPRFPSNDISEQVKFLSTYPDNFKHSFIISPDFIDPDTGRNLHFNQIMKAMLHGGNMTVVIEEVDKWCGPGWEEPGLEAHIDYGRHFRLDMCWVTRNLPAISRKLTSQTTTYYLLSQDEPLYLEKMGERFGGNIIDEVSALQHHHYLRLDKTVINNKRQWVITERAETNPNI